MFRILLAMTVLGGLAVMAIGSSRDSTPERDVQRVLDDQVAAWNRGDIDGFMEGYDRSEQTRFASGGTVVRGWETVKARYKKSYDTREKMGHLGFSELEFTVASSHTVIVFGRWKVTKADATSAGGLFTLTFAKKPEGWRIVADHTSADA